jgi:hypothetical protein
MALGPRGIVPPTPLASVYRYVAKRGSFLTDSFDMVYEDRSDYVARLGIP